MRNVIYAIAACVAAAGMCAGTSPHPAHATPVRGGFTQKECKSMGSDCEKSCPPHPNHNLPDTCRHGCGKSETGCEWDGIWMDPSRTAGGNAHPKGPRHPVTGGVKSPRHYRHPVKAGGPKPASLSGRSQGTTLRTGGSRNSSHDTDRDHRKHH